MPARLPDLVVVGAPKAGTTTLAHWLRQHPGVAFGDRKEVEYFDANVERGLPWYLSQLAQDPGDRVVVEATPTYLSEPEVPGRVAATLPDARFVAVLREPVARAWSNYWFFCQLGLEARRWERAIAEETPGDRLGYLWRGRYAEQLARWDAAVGPDRMHLVLFDDLVADPQAAYDGICAFAGLPQRPVPGRDSVNTTRRARWPWLQRALVSPTAGPLRRKLFVWNGSGPPVAPLPAAEHTRLAPAFTAANRDLEQRLGRPLPARWYPAAP